MKNIILLLCVFSTAFLLSQGKEEHSIFKSSNNWKNEIIKFPVDWAPNLKLTGFEELLFSPNWSNPKSDNFWSLVIGWEIKTKTSLTSKEIIENFTAYFDGLMKPNHWSQEFPDPKVVLTNGKNSKTNFSGKMDFFDGFHTGKLISVNLKIKQHFCEKLGLSVVVFQISPKKEKHLIWETLSEIELKTYICK